MHKEWNSNEWLRLNSEKQWLFPEKVDRDDVKRTDKRKNGACHGTKNKKQQ